MSYQSLQVIGILGKNAEVKTFNSQSGQKSYIKFSVAVSNGKDAQGNNRDSTWFECLYPYNPQTQEWMLREMVAKAVVFLEGRVSASGYISKADNTAQASLNVHVVRLEVLGIPQKQSPQQGYQQQAPQAYAPQGYAPPYPPQGYQPQQSAQGYQPQGGYQPPFPPQQGGDSNAPF